MDTETCPCPGWGLILCVLDAVLKATPTHRRWLYRWHGRLVAARFDEAFAKGKPVAIYFGPRPPEALGCDHMTVTGATRCKCFHGCEMVPQPQTYTSTIFPPMSHPLSTSTLFPPVNT